MDGSDVDDTCFLKNFHEAILKASGMNQVEEPSPADSHPFSPEYACLRTMMLEPRNPTMWNSLALVYVMSGRLDDALEAIVRSLDFDTGNAWTWSIWGDIFYQIGEMTEAERAYRMALELGARDIQVLQRLLQSYLLRNNMSDALKVLELLLPLCPNIQSFWDQYTMLLRIFEK